MLSDAVNNLIVWVLSLLHIDVPSWVVSAATFIVLALFLFGFAKKLPRVIIVVLVIIAAIFLVSIF